jgi:hypothetical protein
MGSQDAVASKGRFSQESSQGFGSPRAARASGLGGLADNRPTFSGARPYAVLL